MFFVERELPDGSWSSIGTYEAKFAQRAAQKAARLCASDETMRVRVTQQSPQKILLYDVGTCVASASQLKLGIQRRPQSKKVVPDKTEKIDTV